MEEIVIYKSSAGSGKTFTLVLAYLKIVLAQPARYRSVLAVTFTNKATEEMKNRIIDTLARLATQPEAALVGDAMYQQLQAHFAGRTDPDFAIPRQARQVLNFILNDYSNFSVSTIEHFFQRIVRAFAKELNVPLGYGVEMRQQEVLQELVDSLLLDLGPAQPGLEAVFSAYLTRELAEDKGWNVDRDLRNLGGEIFQEAFQQLQRAHPGPEDRHAATLRAAQTIDKIVWRTEQRLKSLAQQALSLLESLGLTPDSFKGGKSSSKALYFPKILLGKYAPTDPQRQAVDDPSAWIGKTQTAAQEAALAAGLMDFYREIIATYDDPGYHSALALRQTMYSFGLLQDLEARLVDYRQEHGLLLISDTTDLLARVIQTYTDAPFVYEKVGTRYQHYLLDEFQDTSDAQWHNLLPLVRDALSQGLGSLVVGDAKQSIYRWRNGNMQLLLSGVEAQVRATGQTARVEALQANYRTAADIVRFNNAFFTWAAAYLAGLFPPAGASLIEAAYADVVQEAVRTQVPGWVSIEAFPSQRAKGDEAGFSWREAAMARCLELVRQLRAEGFEGHEICLLVRKNAEGVALAQYLQAEGEAVISAESLLIDSHPRVRLLTALLQAVLASDDTLAEVELAYYHARLVAGETPGHDLFAGPDRLREGLAAFQVARPALRRLPVYACVERLCRLFPLLSEPNAYVQGFLDACLEYATTEDGGLAGFWDWWEEMREKRAIATTPDPGSVQIITIHKAKGLEFPVVILPFCDWELKPKANTTLWVETDWAPVADFGFAPVKISEALTASHFASDYGAEVLMSYLDNLNLLYVALTRPQYRLYLLTEAVSPGKSGLTRVAQLLNVFWSQASLPLGEAGDAAPLAFWHGEALGRDALYAREGKTRPSREASLDLQPNDRPLVNLDEALRIRFSANQFLATGILERHDAIAAGELIHEALAGIGTANDIPAALDRLQLQGTITAGQRPELETQLQRIIGLPAVADWFSGQWAHRAEAEILTPEGRSLRPDRVMTRGTEAVVVDYKAGTAQAKYQQQVRTYMNALRAMGYTQVSGFLYYVQMGVVEAVG